MKIAITGHTAGIGQALAGIYRNQGHEIVGLSQRDGYNIRSVAKIADMIEPCDVFINNAQAGFAQTELLLDVWKRWKNQHKYIISISTMMTLNPVATEENTLYRIEKLALEEMVKQLYTQSPWPKMTLVKPGSVATQLDQTQPAYANVDRWATIMTQCLDIANPDLHIYEIAIGPSYG